MKKKSFSKCIFRQLSADWCKWLTVCSIRCLGWSIYELGIIEAPKNFTAPRVSLTVLIFPFSKKNLLFHGLTLGFLWSTDIYYAITYRLNPSSYFTPLSFSSSSCSSKKLIKKIIKKISLKIHRGAKKFQKGHIRRSSKTIHLFNLASSWSFFSF
jgi:hypothetical protein